ncbi:MAG: ABC transporter substrate-binding protein [Desulfobacterales bacterium]|nr:ABC transporter substrate-binding protein [Desulfobacterales bacterium]MCP4158995.1 ABC transporter substrate-binding protein [Deltaproteobacteria bacterium]
MKKIILISVILLIALTANASTITPTDYVRKKTDAFTAVLDDPKYKKPSMKQIQRDDLWQVIRYSFNYRLISQRALGRNWKKFSKKEKITFVGLFTQLIGKTYLKTIQKNYTGERFSYIKEKMLPKNKALVKTVMISKKYGNIPIDYVLRFKKNKWSVYDIKVENVSLVKNYRVQFKKLLRNKKPYDLIKQLDEKVKENERKN